MDLLRNKAATLSHYEALVLAALQRIAGGIDQALDLQALAAPACMAPLHFHRVFRGLTGETPLQLHRRLRLERAAWCLATQDDPVLHIALQAGYETHEAFTRAFREAYGHSPSEQRRQPRPPRLQAACGLHADGPGIHWPADPAALFTHHGALRMNVQIHTRPAIRVATLAHVGPYPTIGQAFARLDRLAGEAGLLAAPGAQMIAIYHDDPETTPAAQLRSSAGVSVDPQAPLPAPLQEVQLPAGRWAELLHRGAYAGLGDSWQRLLGQWLPHSGQRLAAGDCYERYLNHPGQTPEAALETVLCIPLEG